MKKIILILSLAMCLISITLLMGCDLYNEDYVYDGSSLIGKWMDDDLDPNSYDVYEFVDNETVILTTNCRGIELDKLEGKYTVTDNNQIVIQSKFGKEYIRFSITKKGKLVLIVLNDMNLPAEGERVMKKYDLDYNKGENNLIGTWKSLDNPNEKFIFNSDFTGKSVGLSQKEEIVEYKYYYSYKNDEVNIIIEYMIGYEEMVKTSKFKIENNILTMYGEDKEGKKIEIKFEREV